MGEQPTATAFSKDGFADQTFDFARQLPQILPLLEWVDIRRVCLVQQACSRQLIQAVHGRYLSDAPTGVRARIDKLAKRLSGAQAAQSRGSPDSLAAASVEITVLRQCCGVLGANCEKYADLLERVGFTLDGDDLESVADSLLHTLDKLQSFQNAVEQLREVAESLPRPGMSCRKQASATGYNSDDD
ncbi:unnamed protein product [Polarella glacialis]|uniref:Uncharacterized protein n=1 Tax=Polarella glacialis TaxID=89957 RepID=A0A813L8S7_POLGL|nr:unnamed protein product [Polarella glacialis]